MILTEQHIVSKNDSNWKQIDSLCFQSKNLYNASLYFIKQFYEANKKFIRYNDLQREFYNLKQPDFLKLPTDSSKQILMLIDTNIKVFFKLIKKWKTNKSSLNGCPKFPHYKHKTKGRNIVIFTYPNQIRLKNGYIHFPKKVNLNPIKTNITGTIKQVRLIPKANSYSVEIVYNKQGKELKSGDNYLSIDLGLNNLATCFSTNSNSFIVNGKPIKAINQFYNKKRANIQSQLKKNHDKYSSKKLINLTNKRNNKIKDYFHKSSRIIVNYCLNNNISNIVIGYNKEWKQDINIGKRNNQNFVQIPFFVLLNQLKYKCQLEGINFIQNEESYTSKCSALDLESLEKHENYLGKRVKRGLFISSKNIKINADLNGSINILRKVAPNKAAATLQTLRCRGQVSWPMLIKSA